MRFTSNLLAGCSGTAVGLSSSVMPSLVSLWVASSWLKLRPITRRSSKSAALLSLVSLHTLFSRLRDFRMDFLGKGSPFFTSTNSLTETTVLIMCVFFKTAICLKFSPSEIYNVSNSEHFTVLFLPVNVCWCCDFVKFVMGVSVTVAVFLFPL